MVEGLYLVDCGMDVHGCVVVRDLGGVNDRLVVLGGAWKGCTGLRCCSR